MADGGEKIIRLQCRANFIWTDVERGEAIGFQPDPHRESAAAEQVRALHAFERGETRLHNPHEIICDLICFEQRFTGDDTGGIRRQNGGGKT